MSTVMDEGYLRVSSYCSDRPCWDCAISEICDECEGCFSKHPALLEKAVKKLDSLLDSDAVNEYCEKTDCISNGFEVCDISDLCEECGGDFMGYPNILEEAVSRITFVEEKEKTSKEDIVNHPKHYCRDEAMESIDEMVLFFGAEAVIHFCLCNVWKYRYRSNNKNGEEDIKKSDWYARKAKELCNQYGYECSHMTVKKSVISEDEISNSIL